MIWINTWGFKMSHESWRDLALRTPQNAVEFPWNVNISHSSLFIDKAGTFSEGPTNWDIFRRANSDMGIGPYSRERTWQLRTWSTGCSAHCGLQCLYQLRPPFLGKTAASRAGLKKTFALQLRMNHGKRQRCSLYFSFCEKLKKSCIQAKSQAHTGARA